LRVQIISNGANESVASVSFVFLRSAG